MRVIGVQPRPAWPTALDPTPPPYLQRSPYAFGVIYANVPRFCRRKYFSSLERLQIRHHARDARGHHAGRSSQSSRASSSHPLRPHPPPRDFAQHDVDFFLSLPDKLRKLHYSRDEQAQLLAQCEQPFLPHHHHHDLERARQRFSDFHFGFQRDPDSTSARALLRPRSVSVTSSSTTGRISTWLLDQEQQHHPADAESSLFHLDAMSPPVSKRPPPPPLDHRRTMSLTASSMQYSSSPAIVMGASSGFAMAPATSHQRAHSSSVSGQRFSPSPSLPMFDSEATHYRDPEARKKLRTYLASPQKFDEAIEFGFPSTADSDGGPTSPHYQLPPITSHSRKFSRDMHTFLRDGKLSFFEDNTSTATTNNHDNQGLESDEGSVADMESPTTPSSTGLSFRLHSRQFSHSKMSEDSSRPSPLRPSGQFNREMTLRMTLTRPDLRADEDALYGWQSSGSKTPKDDPYALEDLVFTDDMTGTKGPFYVKPKPRGNLVSRMLKRASLKGR